MSAGSDDAGFLGRWAQRKAQARQKAPELDVAPASGETRPPDEAATPIEAPEPFDLDKLPKLDEITAETNMSDFLRKEAPESLRNAALRRAWALDPAIRDYVNPAMEYAWDWNVPGGAPGSGELAAGFDVAKAVERTFGAGSAASPDYPLVEEATSSATPEPLEAVAANERPPSDPAAAALSQQQAESEKVVDSARGSDLPAGASGDRVIDPARLRKARTRHGGATPV